MLERELTATQKRLDTLIWLVLCVMCEIPVMVVIR